MVVATLPTAWFIARPERTTGAPGNTVSHRDPDSPWRPAPPQASSAGARSPPTLGYPAPRPAPVDWASHQWGPRQFGSTCRTGRPGGLVNQPASSRAPPVPAKRWGSPNASFIRRPVDGGVPIYSCRTERVARKRKARGPPRAPVKARQQAFQGHHAGRPPYHYLPDTPPTPRRLPPPSILSRGIVPRLPTAAFYPSGHPAASDLRAGKASRPGPHPWLRITANPSYVMPPPGETRPGR